MLKIQPLKDCRTPEELLVSLVHIRRRQKLECHVSRWTHQGEGKAGRRAALLSPQHSLYLGCRKLLPNLRESLSFSTNPFRKWPHRGLEVKITLYPRPQEHSTMEDRPSPPNLPSDSDHFVPGQDLGKGTEGGCWETLGRVCIIELRYTREEYTQVHASSLKQTGIFNRQEWARLMRPATANCLQGLEGFRCQYIMMTGKLELIKRK